MKKKIITALAVVLAAVLAFSVYKIIEQQNDNRAGGEAYDQALEAAGLANTPVPGLEETVIAAPEAGTLPENEYEVVRPTTAPEQLPAPVDSIKDPDARLLMQTDLATLKIINDEVIGWLCIPNTRINYPILQTDDNDYYLNHTWDKQRNSVGSIFMEHTCAPDLSDFNTIIYGHRMNDGSMFGTLRELREEENWKKSPRVYIANEAGVYVYDIYAVYKAGVYDITFTVDPGEEKYKRFIRHGTDYSVLDTGIEPTVEDKFLTLVTCTGADYTERWVVQAVLSEVFEREE